MRILLLFFAFLFCTQSFAQPEHLKGLNYNEIANYYISYLKNGALLVRLHTKSRKIEILKKAGHVAAAEKVKIDQAVVNKSIVAAFKEHFKFCPVHFFYSHDSKYILANKLDSITFLNKRLDPVMVPDLPTQFLVAEYGIIKEDTAKIFDGYSRDYQKDSTGSLSRNKQYSGSANMSFGALIIKSPQLVQLSRPFPYYSRRLTSLPILRRSYVITVKRMNARLESFYAGKMWRDDF